MNKVIKTLIWTFLLSLTLECRSQSNNSTHPPEEFTVFSGKLGNGKRAVGSINMAYKKYALKAEYPWCLKLSIGLDLKNVRKDGLPIKEESNIANKFEDELLNEIMKATKAQYVGHCYNDTFLDIYVYLDQPEKVNEYLQKEVKKKDIVRGIAYEIERDPNWTTVDVFFK